MVGIGNSDEASEAQPWGRQDDSRAAFRAQLHNCPYTQALRPLRGLRTWAGLYRPFGLQLSAQRPYLSHLTQS